MPARSNINGKPLYQCVHEELKRQIAAGVYSSGSPLPSETRLADMFAVSSITIRRALQELVFDGLIERRQGIGSFVSDRPANVVIGLASFTTDVSTGNLRLSRTLLTDEVVSAPESVSDKLALHPGALVRRLVRLDVHADRPFSLDEVYLPLHLAAGVTIEVAASPLFFELWQAASGVPVVRLDFELGIEMPSPAQQSALSIGADIPLFVCAELSFDAAGTPLDYIVTRYRADRVRLTTSAILSGTRRI